MNTKSYSLTLLTALALGTSTAYADVVGGVAGGVPEAPAVYSGQDVLPAPVAATVIDFDEDEEPCVFIETTPLRDRYSAMGVEFDGPSDSDGGAVLDECSNFSVTGQSPPNFLAFNTGASMDNGGVPRGPQSIAFDFPTSRVQMNAGSSKAGTITAEAFNAFGSVVDSAAISGTSDLQTILLEGAGITRVVVSFTGTALVIDDLAFQAGDVCDLSLREFIVGCVQGSLNGCDLDGSGQFDFRDAIAYLRTCR